MALVASRYPGRHSLPQILSTLGWGDLGLMGCLQPTPEPVSTDRFVNLKSNSIGQHLRLVIPSPYSTGPMQGHGDDSIDSTGIQLLHELISKVEADMMGEWFMTLFFHSENYLSKNGVVWPPSHGLNKGILFIMAKMTVHRMGI